MKKEKNIEKMAESQNRQGIKDAFAEMYKTMNRTQSIDAVPQITPSAGWRIGQGEGFCIGKGPPGQARSPGDTTPDREIPIDIGTVRGEPPDPPKDGPARRRGGGESPNQSTVLRIEKEELINKKQISNFYKHLIFNLMKKQILILVLFTLALFAGTNYGYGQLGPSTKVITPLSCVGTSEPLHPFPGVPYNYVLTGTAGEEHAASYTWWATQDLNFITGKVTVATMANTNFSTKLASPDVLNLSGTYGATTPAATANSNQVTITWSADMLAKTKWHAVAGDAPKKSTFIVGYAEGENCADNIQVFEINPMPNFLVAIAPIDPADNATSLAWGSAAPTKCVDVVGSAKYNIGTHQIDMDYGTDILYFEVAASNFVKDWTPSFSIVGGLRSTQTATLSIYSTLAKAITGAAGTDIATSGALGVAAMSTTPGTFSWSPDKQLTATTPADAATGVSVFVKVVIANKTEESLTSNPFILAVDARDNTKTGIWDMEDADCTTVTDAPDAIDQATITIKPRPQLDDATTPETITNDNTPVVKTP